MYYTLLTGATGGLGMAFAHLLAKQNEPLVLTATNAQKLEHLQNQLKEAYNANVEIYACDLTSEDSRTQLFAYVQQKQIMLHRVILNAGCILEGDFLSHSIETNLQAVRVNVESAVHIAQLALSSRNTQEPFYFLTISSLAAAYPMPHMGIYAATKSFLTSFMLSLGEELKHKRVHSTVFMPSGIYTTQAMVEAIRSQGWAGKKSSLTAQQAASLAWKAHKKGKKLVIPKSFNRFLYKASKFASAPTLAQVVGKRWAKSQKQRKGEHYE